MGPIKLTCALRFFLPWHFSDVRHGCPLFNPVPLGAWRHLRTITYHSTYPWLFCCSFKLSFALNSTHIWLRPHDGDIFPFNLAERSKKESILYKAAEAPYLFLLTYIPTGRKKKTRVNIFYLPHVGNCCYEGKLEP